MYKIFFFMLKKCFFFYIYKHRQEILSMKMLLLPCINLIFKLRNSSIQNKIFYIQQEIIQF